MENVKEKILEDFKNGLSITKISKKYTIGRKKTTKIIKNAKLIIIKNGKIPLPEQEICNLYNSKQYSLCNLQKKYNLKSDSPIRRILLKNNIKISKTGFNRKKVPLKVKLDINLIKKYYYNDNLSADNVGKLLSVSGDTIKQRLKANNLKVLSNRRRVSVKNSINDNFFDSLTINSAWLIGWILSDGFVKNNKITISLSEKDKDVLEKIKVMLSFKGKIFKRKISLNNKTFCGNYINFYSYKLGNILKANGIQSPKTLNEKFPPIIHNSNDELIIKSFIQGVFEGDGSFINKNKYYCFQIVGTKELLFDIQKYLIKYLNLHETKLTNNIKDKNHFALRYSGKYQSIKIMDWLYENKPEFYIDRKYKYYIAAKEQHVNEKVCK
jgi:hypothetical protein